MTEAARVYQSIKSAILSGEYKQGTVLRQADLATRTGASRTPVREAIIMLAAHRLVRMDARYGATVRAMPVQEFVEINQVRGVLEGAAARLAATRVPEREIQDIAQKLAAITDVDVLNTPAIIDLDQVVHRTFAAHCGNSEMQRLIESFNDLNTLARSLDVEARNKETLVSLARMIEALVERDADRLERLMREHIHEFSKLLPEILG